MDFTKQTEGLQRPSVCLCKKGGLRVDLKQRARRIKTDLPLVFLCLKDAQTPLAAKLFAAAAVAYALSPVDLIPDFVPVLGYLDDVLILPFLIAMSIRLIPPQVLERNRSRAQEIWKDGKPKRWYYAIGIIAVWLLVLVLVVRWVAFAF